MYALRPPYVVILDEVLADPLMRARAERVLAALPAGTPTEVVSVEELPAAAERHNWHRAGGRMGMPPPAEDGGMVFAKMRWDGRWPEHQEAIKAKLERVPWSMRAVYGYDAFTWFSSGQKDVKPCADHVCRPAWRIHLVFGCPHRCFYCGLHEPHALMMNVEEYITKLAELSAKNPWQKTWLYEDDSEALAQEPEYGGLPAVMDFCARSEDNYVIVHTKSANVDWLRDCDHNGRTILTWSLTAETQSRLMEARSATTTERLEAAAKCDAWGYQTRFKFKPIVPVIGWRDELGAMIHQVLTTTRPDSISLFTLAWMKVDELCRLADTSLIDPRFLEAAWAAKDDMAATKVAPFPHELRREVYEFCIDEIRRLNKTVPITLCTETLEMWAELGEKIDLSPGTYPCGCGPQATPGLKVLPVNPWKVAAPVAVTGDQQPTV